MADTLTTGNVVILDWSLVVAAILALRLRSILRRQPSG